MKNKRPLDVSPSSTLLSNKAESVSSKTPYSDIFFFLLNKVKQRKKVNIVTHSFITCQLYLCKKKKKKSTVAPTSANWMPRGSGWGEQFKYTEHNFAMKWTWNQKQNQTPNGKGEECHTLTLTQHLHQPSLSLAVGEGGDSRCTCVLTDLYVGLFWGMLWWECQWKGGVSFVLAGEHQNSED